jgi:DNA-binding protein HU-alpha
MTKAELIATIATHANTTKREAEAFVAVFMDTVADALHRGEEVTLQGFGTFAVKHREARAGRNPATGAPVQIPASNTVGFKPGKSLKDAVA